MLPSDYVMVPRIETEEMRRAVEAAYDVSPTALSPLWETLLAVTPSPWMPPTVVPAVQGGRYLVAYQSGGGPAVTEVTWELGRWTNGSVKLPAGDVDLLGWMDMPPPPTSA